MNGLTDLDIENAKECGAEWAVKFGPEPLRAIVNAYKKVLWMRTYFWGWVISAVILGFVLGFLFGSWEPGR